jgi:hypothetical protein
MRGTLVARGTIEPADLELMLATDSIDEMVRAVERSMAANGPEWSKVPKRQPILGE